MYLVRPSYLLRKLYPQAVWRKDKTQPVIYLTFDDGPIPEVTPWVLDILKQKNILATFFCVGDNVQKHPEIYNRILSENHSAGNHTYNHLNGWNNQTSKYIDNIKLCDEMMNTNTTKRLFRPPYGKIKNSQLKKIKNNYSVTMWDVLSGDYDKNTSPKQCLQNVIKYARNGSIIVFHDSIKAQNNLQYALPRFIEFALENGFVFNKL